MELSTELVLRLLLAANVVLLGGAAIALLRFREQAQHFERFWESPAGVALADTQSLEAQAKACPRPQPVQDPVLARKVVELQQAVRTLAAKDKASGKPADIKLPIENAVRMAKHGASIEELIRTCGLNIGEAQLMRKLHGQARAAGTQTGKHA